MNARVLGCQNGADIVLLEEVVVMGWWDGGRGGEGDESGGKGDGSGGRGDGCGDCEGCGHGCR